MSKKATYDRVVRTVCSPNCMGHCAVNAFVRDGRIVKLEPAPQADPRAERICLRGIAMATQRIHHPDRLTHPLARKGERGSGEWTRISWDEAYDRVAEKMEDIGERYGWRSNGMIKGTGNFGQRAAMSVSRTAAMLGASHFAFLALSGDGAGPAAYLAALGDFMRANDTTEIGGARYLICAGKAVVETGHSEMGYIFDAMENGCKFVVIDPRFSRSAAKADEWVAPRPATDTAMILGMIHVVVTENLFDRAYVLRHTNLPFLVKGGSKALLREADVVPGGSCGYMVWDESVGAPVLAEAAVQPALSGAWTIAMADGAPISCRTAFDANWEVWSQYTPARAEEISGVPAAQIAAVAREYATSDPAWIWLGQGSTRYDFGHLPARAWITLASLCGNIGKPYAGVSIAEGGMMALNGKPAPSYARPGGRVGHSLPGTRLLDVIEQGDPYPIKSLWMVAFGFGTQSPFLPRFIEKTLPNLDLFVVNEQVMTPATSHADFVLPCTSYYEEDWDLVGSGESLTIQLRRRAIDPVGDSRSDHDIFKGLCERLGHGEHWAMPPEEICKLLIAESADENVRKIDWDQLCRDGTAQIPVERPYTPFRDMKFQTPSGRIELYQEQFADLGEEVLVHKDARILRGAKGPGQMPFALMTYKHTHGTHSQHSQLPLIREMIPEPRLEISGSDAADRDIADGDMVQVFNEIGSFTCRTMVTAGLQPGNLAIMQGWWPRDFVEGHPSFLGRTTAGDTHERLLGESNYAIWDVRCDIRKVA